MAQDLQNVIELIDDLKATNLVNVQLLKKALLDINVKLEDISDGSELILVRNSLAEFKENLDNKFNNVFSEIEKLKISSIGDEISEESAQLMQDKFKALFSIFDSGMNLLVTKVDAIEEDFSKLSDKNIEAVRNEFSQISQELKIHQQELVETQKLSHEGAVERFSFVAESIKMLSENINIQTDMYKDFVSKKFGEIKECLETNEAELRDESVAIKAVIEAKFIELEEANLEFANDLEAVKITITEVLNKTEEIPALVDKSLAKEFKIVSDTANDTLAEIKILQDYSTNLTKTVNKITEFNEKNTNQEIIDAIGELNISQNILDLFDKIEAFNTNFNSKTEFLEEQMLQLKTMFSDVSIDIANKESEIVKREVERVQEYLVKVENVSKSLVNLEENLKLSGIEYKEHISTLNKELYEFISEFNSIYNEVSSSAQFEIRNSLDELKQYIDVNSANYNDKLVVIQEQFAQAFVDLRDAVKKNNEDLIAGIKLESLNVEQERLLRQIDSKIDVLASVDLTDNFDELFEQNEESQDLIKNLHAKVDTLLDTESKEEFAQRQLLANKNALESSLNEFKNDFNGEILKEVSLEASEKIIEEFTSISEKVSEKIVDEVASVPVKVSDEVLKHAEEASAKILDEVFSNKDILKELNAKLDVFVATNDTELLTDELQEIKDIILEQQQIVNKDETQDNSLINENIEKLLERIENISKTINEHDENTAQIKEDLVNTVVSVFSNANFVEETEDIKDFVEEKTDEIAKQLIDVQSQLQNIKQNEISDYSYTLSDVENDIAKLRQVVKEMSNSTSASEINQISKNIYNLTSSIDSISKNLTPAEIYQLKHNILKLNDDILSISSRTNKLLLNSDEAQKTIAEGLLGFSHIAYNLEERMQEFSGREFHEDISSKLEKVLMFLDNASGKYETFHQAMLYMGEWVDAASETFEKINSKADEIYEVSEALSELRKVVPEKFELIDMLEERFEEQQSRLDRLEAKIDELSDMSKMNSNFTVIQKVDKMEMLLSTLNANVEKLTSYVD